jgi:hypothetical protein
MPFKLCTQFQKEEVMIHVSLSDSLWPWDPRMTYICMYAMNVVSVASIIVPL